MNDEQLVLKLHKNGSVNENTGSKMMRQKLGDRGRVESERVTSNSPDPRGTGQKNITPKKSALNVGGAKESKYQQPKGVRDSVEDDEIDWVLQENQPQPRKSKFDIQDARETSPDGGSSGLKFLQDDDIPTTLGKKNPQKDRSQKMKQLDQTKRVTQKKLETNLSEEQEGKKTPRYGQ
ncbi:UNKNOWN [Stylonychia lemnae]|uniref:Uncharacterized protein n=1 Tax=Stylonychia lemnae TaxID=5949 RepID=A0A078A130_STYLE|nr:UNKNOWN [Stylonychia lemnae]|eukprot:CDW74484.1 UNKNOWN [Stylonychia lemnae]